MVLYGKLSTEFGIKTSADKFYKLIATELHQVQKHCERVRYTKLHEGEDWHDTDTIKHWSYVIGNYISNSINMSTQKSHGWKFNICCSFIFYFKHGLFYFY